VEELHAERSLSHPPLFQVMLVLQNAPMGELELPGLKLSPVGGGGSGPGGEAAAAKFELTLTLFESREGLRGAVNYNRDLFEPETIERMVRHLTTLFEGVVSDVTQRLSSLPLLSAADRRQQLVTWNETAKEYPQHLCLHQLFEEQALRSPSATALVCGDLRLSYAELDHRANRVASQLLGLGAGPESLVGLLCD